MWEAFKVAATRLKLELLPPGSVGVSGADQDRRLIISAGAEAAALTHRPPTSTDGRRQAGFTAFTTPS